MTILRTPTFIAAVSILLSLTGCNEHVIYHSYRHVPEQGWNSRDTFTFDIDTVRTAATYQFALGLRSTDSSVHRYLAGSGTGVFSSGHSAS